MRSVLLLLPLVVVGTSLAQSTDFTVGPQYLITGSALFLRPIATPTLSLNAPLPPLPSMPEIGPPVSNQPYVSDPALQNQADLFPIFYGYPEPEVVELTSTVSSEEIPASISDTVANIPSAQVLREFGNGVTLAESAAYWKKHRPQNVREYTNADIERLQQHK